MRDPSLYAFVIRCIRHVSRLTIGLFHAAVDSFFIRGTYPFIRAADTYKPVSCTAECLALRLKVENPLLQCDIGGTIWSQGFSCIFLFN